MYFTTTGILYKSRDKLAQGLGLSRDTVRNWFRSGQISHQYKDITIYKVLKVVEIGTRNHEGNVNLTH